MKMMIWKIFIHLQKRIHIKKELRGELGENYNIYYLAIIIMMDPYYNGLAMSPVYVPSRMYREQLTMGGGNAGYYSGRPYMPRQFRGFGLPEVITQPFWQAVKFIQNTAKGGRDILAEAVKEHGAKGISKVAQLAADVASGKVSRKDLEIAGKSFVQSMKKSIIKRGMQEVSKVIFGKNPKNAM